MKQTLFLNIIGIDIWPAEVDLYQVSLKDDGKVVRRQKPGEPSQNIGKEREKSALYLNFFSRRWEKIIKTAKKESSPVPLLRALCYITDPEYK